MESTTITSLESHPKYLEIVNELSLSTTKIEELSNTLGELKEALRKAEHTCKLYRKALYGQSSEKKKKPEEVPNDGRPISLSLFPSEDLETRPKAEGEDEKEVITYVRSKKKKHVDPFGDLSHFPEHLPREEIPVETDCNCKSCGDMMKEIGKRITEELHTIPAQYKVLRYIRKTYKCDKCQKVVNTDPNTNKNDLLPKSILGNSFLASSIVGKFGWHLPFYRQSQMLSHQGIDIPRSMLINSVNKLCGYKPGADKIDTTVKSFYHIVDQMHKEILSESVVHMDETPITVAKRTSGKKKYNGQSYFWPILGGDQVVFCYTGNRKHGNVIKILKDNYHGTIMSDCYGAYKAYAKVNPEVSLAFCWDHARCKFYELKDEDPLAEEAINHISGFYKIEKEIKEFLSDEIMKPEQIPKYRRDHCKQKLEDFKKWCEVVRDAPETLPKSKLMAAVCYVINHWDGLTLYLDHGNVPISNIKIEHQIRNLKLGAKNWLFASSENGAKTIAIMNSLVCTCKMNNINLQKYFEFTLENMGKLQAGEVQADKLTPLAYKQPMCSSSR